MVFTRLEWTAAANIVTGKSEREGSFHDIVPRVGMGQRRTTLLCKLVHIFGGKYKRGQPHCETEMNEKTTVLVTDALNETCEIRLICFDNNI